MLVYIQGRWLPPAGFDASVDQQPTRSGEEGSTEARRLSNDPPDRPPSKTPADDAALGKQGSSVGNDRKAALGGESRGGDKHRGPVALVTDVLSKAPRHESLQMPCMRLSALRTELRKRLGGKPFDKVTAHETSEGDDQAYCMRSFTIAGEIIVRRRVPLALAPQW